jgi:hypothetical protein
MSDCVQSLVSSCEGVTKHNNAVNAVNNFVVDYKVLIQTFCKLCDVLNRFLVFTFCHFASCYKYVHWSVLEVWLRQLYTSTLSVKLSNECLETELILLLNLLQRLALGV